MFSCDNIVKLFAVYDSDSYAHLVMDYQEGGDLLEKVIEKDHYNEGDAITLMESLLLALDFMHNQGIIHRDLKLQNILVSSMNNDFDLRVADFGLATLVPRDGSKLTRKCGSPGYTAPEMLKGQGYTVKADCFSVGSILFNLLTGEPLFNGNSAKEIFKLNKECDISAITPLIDKLPYLAKDLLLKLITPAPDERLSASEALGHEWFAQDKEALASSLLVNRQLSK